MKSPSNILETFSLTGKIALLTGGAGLYGRAMLTGLTEAGATVIIASRNLIDLELAATEARSVGHDVTALEYDQASIPSIDKLTATIRERWGRLDVLINNATARPMKSYDDSVAAFAASMQINATGLFALTRHLGDLMAERSSGSIINIGSIQGSAGPDASLYAGLEMDGFIPDYFFHKGGLLNYTRFLAAHYGKHGIRCNCLSPGGVVSDQLSPDFVRRYSDRTFLDRMASPQDIRGALVFLASDASRYVTGTNLPVDGGYAAK